MSSNYVKDYLLSKIKSIKKISRSAERLYGKCGFHKSNKDRPRQNKNLHEYMEEIEEDGELK